MEVTCAIRTSEPGAGAPGVASEAQSSGKNACLAAFLALVGYARPSSRTLAPFSPGEPTEDWLISVVGPPISRTDRFKGISILRYSTGLLSRFIQKSSRSTATIYFIVRDGVITQLWADRETEHTLLGTGVPASWRQGGRRAVLAAS